MPEIAAAAFVALIGSMRGCERVRDRDQRLDVALPLVENLNLIGCERSVNHRAYPT